MIARVAVSKTNFDFEKLFSYRVPSEMFESISVGSRVKVPFGTGNHIRDAFVVELSNDQELNNEVVLKELQSLCDIVPLLDKNSIDISRFISKKYFCSMYDSLSLLLPKYIKNNYVDSKIQNDITISPISLSEYQNSVYGNIINWFYNSKINESLLYGITGSGKTNLFLKLAQDAISNGKNVLILVPEISLIPQMMSNIELFFGKNSFACLHSGLTPKKRANEWLKIKNNIVNLAIGTRSAIFAPFVPDLIVIDEEQESTYKSDKSPRFHAKDIARFFCKKYNSKLLLASATPSIESFYLAKTGKIELFELRKRYGSSELPKVKIVNISKNIFNAKSILSNELVDKLNSTILSNKQSILLLDRRGYHSFARCSHCGTTIMCKNCSTTLNHHKIENQDKLICHYCGYFENIPKTCRKCGMSKICLIGVGTQSLEDEINSTIRGAKCIRVDADTTKSKKEYERIFKEFKEQKYNIMIGTRMVAKGLDFENVNLVGILCADQSLLGEGYKSYEKTFSLISQAVGRSGRHDSHGEAIIQTYSNNNYAIELSASQDYDKFFENEIAIRKIMLYPPFADICTVGFIGTNENYTWKSCLFFFESLKFTASSKFSDIPLKILSPSKAFMKKMEKKFRFKIVVKCKNNSRFRKFIIESLNNYRKNDKINNTEILKKNKNATDIFFDVNAENLF